MPDPFVLERAAAAAWPAAVAEERDGWLLRATPEVPHRRNNSALPLAPRPPLAVVEAFYGAEAVVAVAPLEGRAALDAELERAGWTAEGATDVLVARAGAVRLPVAEGVAPVDPLAWPNEGVRTHVLGRARDELRAFAVGQDGAVLCIRTGEVAGVFRLHVAPVLYAQVECDNAAAQALFAAAGFTRSHGYHYRRAIRR